MDNKEMLDFHFDVDGKDFSSAGEASVQVKKILRRLGIDTEVIRRVSIAMYEAEINMVIHAGGGEADVYILPDKITLVMTDHGPGIADIELVVGQIGSLLSVHTEIQLVRRVEGTVLSCIDALQLRTVG